MICVDASVAFKWLVPFDEERVELALALLADHLARREELVAPPLIWGEIANSLHQRVRNERLTFDWAADTLEDFLTLPLIIDAHETLYQDALRIASEFRLPAIYDAQYVALAQYAGCDLWTDDHKLIQAVQNDLPFVRSLRDYEPRH